MTILATVWQLVSALFSGWHNVKMMVEGPAVVSDDSLHVIAGVVVQILFAAVLRRPLSSWGPWFAVLGALAFNEAVDFWVERWPSLASQLGESAKDLVITLCLPTILMLSLRLLPVLNDPRRR